MRRLLLFSAAVLTVHPAFSQWSQIPHAVPALDLNDILAFSGTDDYLVVGDSGLAIESTDGFATAPNVQYIDTTGEDDLLSIDINAQAEWWVSGRGGTVLITRNPLFPKAWTDVSPAGETADFSIYSNASGVMFAAGNSGKLLHGMLQPDTTVVWDTLTVPTAADLNEGNPFSGGEASVVGDGGVIIQTLNGADFWVDTTLGVDLFNIASIGGTALLAVGADGSIYKNNNSGSDTAWVKKLGGLGVSLFDISGGGSALLVAGQNGTILRSTDNGESWCQDSTGVSADLFGVYVESVSVQYAAGANGLILETTTGGGPCTSVALPVELTRFEAYTEDRDVVLVWETASEVNNSHFEIERWNEGYEFVVRIDGAGTTQTRRKYSYRVPELEPGRHTFRLKQVDFDGTARFSRSVSVEVLPDRLLDLGAVWPNPASASAVVRLATARSQFITVELFDALGRRMKLVREGQVEAGKTVSIQLQTGDLVPGLYAIRATAGSVVQQSMFLVAR